MNLSITLMCDFRMGGGADPRYISMAKQVAYPAIPRVGDLISTRVEGWADDICEYVTDVMFEDDGITVFIGVVELSSSLPEAEEDKVSLENAGWVAI